MVAWKQTAMYLAALFLSASLLGAVSANQPVNAGVNPETLDTWSCETLATAVIATGEVTASGNNPRVRVEVFGSGPLGSASDEDEDSGAFTASASATVTGVFLSSWARVWVSFGGEELVGKCNVTFSVVAPDP